MGRRRHRGRTGLGLLLAVLAVCAFTAGPAAASGQDVVNDFKVHGVIVGTNYTVRELQDSKRLFAVEFPGQTPAIFPLVDAKIAAVWGQSLADDPPNGTAPQIPSTDVPVWLTVLAAAAGLLALSGVGAEVYRRTRRARA